MTTTNTIEQTEMSHQLSIVIPMYNEEDNVAPMAARVNEAMAEYQHPWELILVDDGSSDETIKRMSDAITTYGDHIQIIELQRNFGQTAAMQAGIDAAAGDVIATLDGDLQNDPWDIPRLVKRLLEEELDLVAGWRASRQDNWLRKIPSFFANRLIVKITGVKLHDYGCTLKVYRSKVIKDVRLYGEMHRFIPALVATATSPSRIREEAVKHHARQFGESKYGISRTFRVILDLLSVYFFMQFRSRPSHFFGKIGLIFGMIGTLMLSYLMLIKLFLGEDIGSRPLLFIAILFIVVAVQLLTTGVMSELLTRTYYESSDNRSYIIRNTDETEANTVKVHWKKPV